MYFLKTLKLKIKAAIILTIADNDVQWCISSIDKIIYDFALEILLFQSMDEIKNW